MAGSLAVADVAVKRNALTIFCRSAALAGVVTRAFQLKTNLTRDQHGNVW